MSKFFKQQKEGKGDKTLARYIFEARFVDRLIPFVDRKGEILDQILKRFELDRFVITDDRVEATNADQRLKVFFSSSNFGFQLEGSEALSDFDEVATKLIGMVSQNGLASGRKILRLGTKSEVYFHPGGKSFGEIKGKYLEKLVTGISEVEKSTGASVTDIGITNLTMRDADNRMMSITTGPMDANQITTAPFFSTFQKQKNNVASCGIFISTDLYTLDKNLHVDGLQEVSSQQIQKLHERINGFVSWLMQ